MRKIRSDCQIPFGTDKEARGLGLRDIGLHVFAHNDGAQALYHALGYEVTGLNMRKAMA